MCGLAYSKKFEGFFFCNLFIFILPQTRYSLSTAYQKLVLQRVEYYPNSLYLNVLMYPAVFFCSTVYLRKWSMI